MAMIPFGAAEAGYELIEAAEAAEAGNQSAGILGTLSRNAASLGATAVAERAYDAGVTHFREKAHNFLKGLPGKAYNKYKGSRSHAERNGYTVELPRDEESGSVVVRRPVYDDVVQPVGRVRNSGRPTGSGNPKGGSSNKSRPRPGKATSSLSGDTMTKKKKAPNSKAKAQSFVTSASAAPVAFSFGTLTRRPKRTTTRHGFRIQHSELIADIRASGSSEYEVKQFLVNPGIAATFPWLSGEATRFEEYVFHDLVFTYVPVCGTATVGKTQGAYSYDVLDPVPEDKFRLGGYSGCAGNAVYKFCSCRADVSGIPWKVVRTGPHLEVSPVAGGLFDAKTYDFGQFFMALNNVNTAGTYGELHVSYDVEFRHARPVEALGLDYKSAYAGTTVDKFSPFGTATTIQSTKLSGEFYNGFECNLPVVISYDSTGSYSDLVFYQTGVYQITYFLSSGNALTGPLVLTLEGSPAIENVSGGSGYSTSAVYTVNPTGTSLVSTQKVRVASAPLAIRFDGTPIATSFTVSALWINQGKASVRDVFTVLS
jgi:hypothetical protein